MSSEGAQISAPEVLVLGGGGVLGEVWMSALLAGVERTGAFDARECASFIGTSAGSIVAAALAAGVPPSARLGQLAHEPASSQAQSSAGRVSLGRGLQTLAAPALGLAAPLASLALYASEPVGAALRRALLAQVPTGRRSLARLAEAIERLGLRWDGRVRIAAVDLQSGRRVMFGAPAAPAVSVADAVVASCAIPGVFRPMSSGGRSYVDGGVWSPTNMDTASASRGARVLCLNPTGSLRASTRVPGAALGIVSRSIAAAEALALRRRGARVTVVNPDERSRAAMGADLLDPRPRAAVAAAGLQQGQRIGAGLAA